MLQIIKGFAVNPLESKTSMHISHPQKNFCSKKPTDYLLVTLAVTSNFFSVVVNSGHVLLPASRAQPSETSTSVSLSSRNIHPRTLRFWDHAANYSIDMWGPPCPVYLLIPGGDRWRSNPTSNTCGLLPLPQRWFANGFAFFMLYSWCVGCGCIRKMIRVYSGGGIVVFLSFVGGLRL